MNKFFNGRKYFFSKEKRRWFRTTGYGRVSLSHDVWNFFHPDDPILRGDGNVIDHINEDKSDDRIENLRKMTSSEHSRMHMIGNQYNLGKHWSLTDKTKQKIRDANLGKHLSEETKQKIREANLGHIVTDETKQKLRGSKNSNWKGGKKK